MFISRGTGFATVNNWTLVVAHNICSAVLFRVISTSFRCGLMPPVMGFITAFLRDEAEAVKQHVTSRRNRADLLGRQFRHELALQQNHIAMEQGTTMRDIVAAMIDLLTVSAHSILFYRSLYPKASFIRAQKYNLPVPQSRHPKVCEWINEALSEVEKYVLRDAISRVVLLIYGKESNDPRERFVFDLSHLPSIPEDWVNLPLEGQIWNDEEKSILPTVDMEECLRAMMSRLAQRCLLLPDLKDECTFALTMETKATGILPFSEMEFWITVPAISRDTNSSTSPVLKCAIRNVAVGLLILESWYEKAQNF